MDLRDTSSLQLSRAQQHGFNGWVVWLTACCLPFFKDGADLLQQLQMFGPCAVPAVRQSHAKSQFENRLGSVPPTFAEYRLATHAAVGAQLQHQVGLTCLRCLSYLMCEVHAKYLPAMGSG